MRILVFLSFFLFLFACQDKKNTENETESKVDKQTMHEQAADVDRNTDIRPLQDREPRIEMINVEFNSQGKAGYRGWIQDRDAKYYLVDGGYGTKLSFTLQGSYKGLQYIVINPDSEMILQQTINNGQSMWEGTFEKSGRYTFIVQLDSAIEGKEQIRTKYQVELRSSSEYE